MKKIFRLLLTMLCCLFLIPGSIAYASGSELWDSYTVPSSRQKERLLDAADLLIDSDEKDILKMLNEISQKHQSNVVILTVNEHTGSIQDYADDYFDYNGFGTDYDGSGVLFMLSMNTREWAISTSGTAIEAFTDYGQEHLMDEMLSYLSDGDYYLAFDKYISIADQYFNMYEQGNPYDVNNTKDPSELKTVAIASIIIGFIVALIIVGIMAAQLTSVRMNESAEGYQSHSGIHMDVHRDSFIRTSTSKKRLPESDGGSRSGGGGGSSTHYSSSGSSHGGSSGHF